MQFFLFWECLDLGFNHWFPGFGPVPDLAADLNFYSPGVLELALPPIFQPPGGEELQNAGAAWVCASPASGRVQDVALPRMVYFHHHDVAFLWQGSGLVLCLD